MTHARLDRIPLHFVISNIFKCKTTDPSFLTITKPLSNKRGDAFCEGLE